MREKLQLCAYIPHSNQVDVYFCGYCNCQFALSHFLIAMMVASLNHFDDIVGDVIAILNHFRMKTCDLNCRRAHKFGFLLDSAFLCEEHRNFLTGCYTQRCLDCGQK